MTRTLAALVSPEGRATGVEPNPKLRELAANRVASVPGAGVVDGLAADLPVADGSVDLLWCERVLQHLADEVVRAVQSAAEAGHAYSAATMFGFVLHKPAA